MASEINHFTESPQSFWIASTPSTAYPALTEDIAVDIAIVGAGITGITSAYLLTRAGCNVCVIDAGPICHGASAHTTAKITSQHGLTYNRIITGMGEALARQYADANQTALHEIAHLVHELKIDCDFSWQQAYVYTQQDDYIDAIRQEADAAAALGLKASYLTELPLPLPVKAALCFEEQAQFHPRKYLLHLANEITAAGGLIFEQTKMTDVIAGAPLTLIADNGMKITANKLIIASHYPFHEAMGLYFTRLYPERSYGLAVKINGSYPGGMYISAEDPARSLRSQPTSGSELILVSGEHHKTGQGPDTNTHYHNLADFAESLFDVEDIPYRWSTQDYTTADEIPYIGNLTHNTPDIYVATGFRKWGMTTGMVSALIFRDLIMHGHSPWSEVYSPSRFTPGASALNFVKENLNVAKHLIAGKILPVPNHITIPAGEGQIVDINGERVGAYRDEKGRLHLVDTTCTHLGCELQWNSAEKSWDCPCHGSRFTYEGEIIASPALHELAHINDD